MSRPSPTENPRDVSSRAYPVFRATGYLAAAQDTWQKPELVDIGTGGKL